jgi:hypothetical protein
MRLCLLLACLLPAALAAAPRTPPKPVAKPPAPGTLTGRVLLPGGKPAAGARVWVSWAARDGAAEGFLPATADASGGYRVVLTPRPLGFLLVGAHAEGGSPTWKRLDPRLLGPRPARIDLTLAAPVVLSGRTIQPSGAPTAGVRVGIRSLRPPAPANATQEFWLNVDRYVDPTVLRLFVAHSGPDGAFQLGGLPPHCEAGLQFPADLLLPYAFPEQVGLGKYGPQALGHVVLVRPAALSVLVTAADGKAAPGAAVFARRVLPEPADPAARALTLPWRTQAGAPRAVDVEEDGTGRLERLPPGRYEVALQGRVVGLDLAEGAAPPPLRLTQRPGLAGRVVDAAGKPVPMARVLVEVGSPRRAWPPGSAAALTADAKGEFRCEDYPWHAGEVVVRATLGAAEAEWRGEGGKTPSPLTLALRPNALLTVRGRLLGPDGRPLAGKPVALFARTDGRPQGLVVTRADNEGRFTAAGVPRGAVFACGTVVDETPLETAAITAPTTGDTVDLGDLRVAPSAPIGLSQAALVAGFNPGPILPPAAAEAAAEAVWRYVGALRAGDVPTLDALTSVASPGGPTAAARPLLLPMEVAGLQRAGLGAIRVFPRLFPDAFFGPLDSESAYAALLEALSRPEWALVGWQSPRGVTPLALLRLEGGGWKLVGGLLAGAQPLTTAPGDSALWGRPGPAESPEAARAAAQTYLGAWAAGDGAARLALTHPQAPEFAPAAEEFARRWAARTAAAPDAAASLAPETTLTQWDLASLFVYPATLAAMRAGRRPPEWAPTRFPYPQVREGRVAVFRYQAGARARLMLLAREGERWLVVEPALPEGAP